MLGAVFYALISPKIVCRPGCARTRWGAYVRSPDAPAELRGPLNGAAKKGGRERKERERKERKRREAKEGKGRAIPPTKILATALFRYNAGTSDEIEMRYKRLVVTDEFLTAGTSDC